jgi:hypothetical protein
MFLTQTGEQLQALSEFQSHCEIRDVTLLMCSALRAKLTRPPVEPISIRPSLSNISSRFQGDCFMVEVSFEYSAWDSSEPPERVFLINSTFEVTYQMLDEYSPSQDAIQSFSRGTAVFNCWPYAREFLSDITARMGHQAPALPLLRIAPKKEAKPAKQQPTEQLALTSPEPIQTN